MGRNDFEYKGVKYDSMKSCCLALGLKFKTVTSYCHNHNISFETALDMYIDGEVTMGHKGTIVGRNTYVYRGVEYNSKKDCCSAFGLRYGTVDAYRHEHSMTFESALDEYVDKRVEHSAKDIEINGKYYESIKDCCEDLGITYKALSTFKCRNNISNTVDAVYAYLNSKDSFVYNGMSYSFMKDCCNALDISCARVRYYMGTIGLSFDEAVLRIRSKDAKKLETLKVDKARTFEFRGRKYKSKKECCDILGLKVKNVHSMAKSHNVTFEIALSKILDGEYESGKSNMEHNTFEYNGVVYSSKLSCCKKYDLSYNSVKYYTDSHNIDFIDALDAYLGSDAGHSFEYHNVVYKSKKDCCDTLGLSVKKVWDTACKRGVGFVEALDIVRNDNSGCYSGFEYYSIDELYKRFNVDSCTVGKIRCRFKVDLFDAVDYCRIYNKFELFERSEFFKHELFGCKCNLCGGRFLFTRDLAFKHIEECNNGKA